MNIAKVKKTVAFVNYVKPEVEMVEIEVEGAILGTSGGGTSGPMPGLPQTGPSEGSTIGGGGNSSGGSFSARNPRVRR
jgi:hypothetical protein